MTMKCSLLLNEKCFLSLKKFIYPSSVSHGRFYSLENSFNAKTNLSNQLLPEDIIKNNLSKKFGMDVLNNPKMNTLILQSSFIYFLLLLLFLQTLT